MSKIFEIVIFTAALEDYANFILNQLDPTNELIQHRLYRQHCDRLSTGLIKDLSKLGRLLSKTIIVDNLSENFSKQPRNGIEILSWEDDPNDCELEKLGD